MRRTWLFALMLAVFGLYTYARLATPITLVSSVGQSIAHGGRPLPYSVHSALTGIAALLIAVRTLHPQRYRAVAQWIHAQR